MADNFRNSPSDEEKFKFDSYAHATTTMDEEHRLIHDGMVFYRPYFETAVADDTSRTALFRTGATPPHFKRFNVSASEGPITVSLREDAVVTTLGTELDTYNLNRLSSRVSLAKFYGADTVFADIGNPLLGDLFIPGGGNNVGIAGTTAAIEEFILKPNTDYSLTVTNTPAGSGASDISVAMVWYEIGYET